MYYVRVRVNFELFSKSYDDFGRSWSKQQTVQNPQF